MAEASVRPDLQMSCSDVSLSANSLAGSSGGNVPGGALVPELRVQEPRTRADRRQHGPHRQRRSPSDHEVMAAAAGDSRALVRGESAIADRKVRSEELIQHLVSEGGRLALHPVETQVDELLVGLDAINVPRLFLKLAQNTRAKGPHTGDHHKSNQGDHDEQLHEVGSPSFVFQQVGVLHLSSPWDVGACLLD